MPLLSFKNILNLFLNRQVHYLLISPHLINIWHQSQRTDLISFAISHILNLLSLLFLLLQQPKPMILNFLQLLLYWLKFKHLLFKLSHSLLALLQKNYKFSGNWVNQSFLLLIVPFQVFCYLIFFLLVFHYYVPHCHIFHILKPIFELCH